MPQKLSKAIRGSSTSWRAKHGFKPVRIILDNYELGSPEWDALWEHPQGGRRSKSHLQLRTAVPAWWDRVFHVRPKRASTHALERKVLIGADPDGLVWPLGSHKPHFYYD